MEPTEFAGERGAVMNTGMKYFLVLAEEGSISAASIINNRPRSRNTKR